MGSCFRGVGFSFEFGVWDSILGAGFKALDLEAV